MKKEFWRKAPQCAKCIYHCPEGTRPDSIDPTTVWKEACHCCGYSFWPELGEAEMCFDFKTEGPDSAARDKAEKEQWARQHLCHQCAFWENNGIAYLDCEDKNRQAEWELGYRCQGFLHLPGDEPICRTFLTIEQWKEIESTPTESYARGEKYSLFRKRNMDNHI